MEGPLLAYKILVLIAVFGWIYQRLERVHGRFPAFERFLRARPLLAAVRARDPRSIVASIQRTLGPTGRALAGSGRRPWPFYALTIELEVLDDTVYVRATSARLLRVEGADPPSLVAVLRDALPPDADGWVHPALWVDLVGDARPSAGWRLASHAEEPIPQSTMPGWLRATPCAVPEP